MPEYSRRAVVALTAAAAILLAGCAKDTNTGTATPELPSKTSTPSSTTSTTTPGPVVNERGLLPKALGQEAGLADTAGGTAATFSIDNIAVDPPCAEHGTKPDAGHILLLDVRAATGGDPEVATYLAGILNPFNFAEVGADGVTRDAQPGSCTDYTKALTNEFGINQKYAGTIEIVVSEASGVLALKNGTGGWEWTY